SVSGGKRLDLMPCIFHCSGLVCMDMTAVRTDDALVRAERRCDHGIVGLCAAEQKMYSGVRTVQVFFYLSFGFFAPLIQSVSAVTLMIRCIQRFQDGWVCAVIVI